MGFFKTLEFKSLRRLRCRHLLLNVVAQQSEKEGKAGVRENDHREAMALTAMLWRVDQDLALFSRQVPFKDLFAFLLVSRCQKMRSNVVPTR